MNHTYTKEKFPDNKHFAALLFSTIHIPGDERSRTHPGHGYPATTQPVVSYIVFDSREEMERWVSEQEARRGGGKNYQLIEAAPLSVTTTTSVSIGG